MIVAFANGECTPAASSHLARHRWGSSTRRAEHRPLACAPSGDSPRCCSSEHQRSKTPLAHRLESQHRTAAFDFARDLPVHVRRHACDSPRQNFPALGHELFQQIGILVIDCFRRDIDAAARHGAIGASKGGAAFGGLWLHEISESRGEAYAFSKTDCIFSFPTGSGCAGSSCFASTYNAKPVCPKP